MQVVIDRIEGNMAILEIQEGPIIELPVKFLPKGIKEGSVLNILFKIDTVAERAKLDKVKNLQQKLSQSK